ncbi:unnamed protein product [Amoebophrya sp. A25]|nr:unnamed protein product [Amoebophrya sp. A25]|eukprot:GSA25T00004959001.1
MSSGAERHAARVARLQQQPDRIRNVCLIAHVDHGKTSLCDSLVASNGWISRKVAGSLRFLDSREDEQARMITMKSSAISLCWTDKQGQQQQASSSSATSGDARILAAQGQDQPTQTHAASATTTSTTAASTSASSLSTTTAAASSSIPQPLPASRATTAPEEYLINVVDSPGHVDFTSEVSTATRLSDGAIVLVDVVEGISSQTREVLRQAWRDQLKTILVLNKMDRLFINLKLTPDEACVHIQKVIQQVNAAAAELLMAEVHAAAGNHAATSSSTTGSTGGGQNEMSASNGNYSTKTTSTGTTAATAAATSSAATTATTSGEVVSPRGDHELVFDSEREQSWTYHPAKGNVLFTSAMHGWGFSVAQFASFMAKRMSCSERVLRQTLWGDYWYNPKEKKILKKRPTDGPERRLLFAQFCLDTIARFYQATATFDNSDNAAMGGGSSSAANTTSAGSMNSKNAKAASSASPEHQQLDIPLLEKLCKSVPELHGKVDFQKLRPGCVRDLLGTWLPLGDCVLRAAVEYLPSPRAAAAHRIPFLLEYPIPMPAQSSGYSMKDAASKLFNAITGGGGSSSSSSGVTGVAAALTDGSSAANPTALEGDGSTKSATKQEEGAAAPTSGTSTSDVVSGVASLAKRVLVGGAEALAKAASAGTTSADDSKHEILGRALLEADNSAELPAVAYCTKYLGADLSRQILLGDRLVHGSDGSDFVGMCRVFAGTLKPGMLMMQATGKQVRSSRGKTCVTDDAGSSESSSSRGERAEGTSGTPFYAPASRIKNLTGGAGGQNTTSSGAFGGVVGASGTTDRPQVLGDDHHDLDEAHMPHSISSSPELVSPACSDGLFTRESPVVLQTPPVAGQDWVVLPDQDLGAGAEEGPLVDTQSLFLKDWTTLRIAKVYTILGTTLMPVECAGAGAVVAVSFEDSKSVIHRTDRYLTLVQMTDSSKGKMRRFNEAVQKGLKSASSSNALAALAGGASTSATASSGGGSSSGAPGASSSSSSSPASTISFAPDESDWLPIFKSPYQTRSFAIVKVSVETKLLEHNSFLQKGLALLHRSDPSLDVSTTAAGEHVIGCCGDEHLKRCVKDLQQLYLPPHVAIQVSEPLIALRETIDVPKNGFGSDLITLPWAPTRVPKAYPVVRQVKGDRFTVTVRAEPLPRGAGADETATSSDTDPDALEKEETEAEFRTRVSSFLPNLIAVRVSKGARTALSCLVTLPPEDSWVMAAVVSGFEVASLRGPLCDEPVQDVHFIVENITDNTKEKTSVEAGGGADGPVPPGSSRPPQPVSRAHLSGHVLAAVREACAEAMLRRSTCRIAEPVLLLDLQCEGSSMGKVYGVLGKRRCQTLEEGFREGTSIFLLKIKIPMVESFNLSGEIRHVASGDVHYHARFLRFETIPEDPFPEQALTQEDIEVEGETNLRMADSATHNIPRKILTSVRKRKGLLIDERVVKDAQKQRNLTRMK